MKIKEAHQSFTDAGADILLTSTSKQVIVGSLGPYGAYLSDGSEYTGDYELSNEDYFKFHRLRIDALITRGIHDFVFETVPNFEEIKAVVEYIVPHYTDQTFWLSVTVNDLGDLSDGTKFEDLCEFIQNIKKKFQFLVLIVLL